jgi:hypothetical protein
MYVSGGHKMEDVEEGAAFFPPIGSDIHQVSGVGALSPRIMGVNRNQLTRGYSGFGADDYIAPPPNTPGYDQTFGQPPAKDWSVPIVMVVGMVGVAAVWFFAERS